MENCDPRKMTGGEKHKWLRENRQIVLDYLAKYGKGTAMIRFGISHPETLDSLIEKDCENDLPVNSYEVRLAVATARRAIESAKQAHIEIRGLEQSYEHFIESLANQLNQKFLLPLLRLAFTLDTSPFKPRPDELSPDSIFNVPRLTTPKPAPKLKGSQRLKKIYLSAHPLAQMNNKGDKE